MGDRVQARLSRLCELAASELADVQSKTGSSSPVSNTKNMLNQHLRRALVSRCAASTRLLPDLPRRVLHCILELLGVRDCISVSETCSALREVCLAHPPLWNTICMPRRTLLDVIVGQWPDNNFDGTRALLTLSRPDPVRARLALDYPGAARDALLDILTESTSRASVLSLEVYREAIIDVLGQRYYTHDPPSLEDWNAISTALCQPAPFLRALLLYRQETSSTDYLRVNPFHPGTDLPLNPYIFGGIPGALRVCCLRGINIPVGGCAALAMLRTLDYQSLGKHLRGSHLIEIIQQMPHLEVLGLTISQFVDDTDWSGFEHRSLSGIAVEADENFLDVSAQCMPFLSHLGAIALITNMALEGANTLHISRLRHVDFDWNRLVEVFGYPEHLRVCGDMLSQAFDITANTRRLRLSPYRSQDLAHFPGAFFTRLTSLTLHAELWDHEHVPPPAPELVRLHVVCHYIRETSVHEATFGIFVVVAHAPWRCPLLRELQFSFSTNVGETGGETGRDGIGAVTISLGDIFIFIKTAVAFEAPRLSSVRLHGVSALADPDPAAAFIALQDVVEGFELSASCSPDSQALLDIEDTFSQPPARYFDSSVPNDSRQPCSQF